MFPKVPIMKNMDLYWTIDTSPRNQEKADVVVALILPGKHEQSLNKIRKGTWLITPCRHKNNQPTNQPTNRGITGLLRIPAKVLEKTP